MLFFSFSGDPSCRIVRVRLTSNSAAVQFHGNLFKPHVLNWNVGPMKSSPAGQKCGHMNGGRASEYILFGYVDGDNSKLAFWQLLCAIISFVLL